METGIIDIRMPYTTNLSSEEITQIYATISLSSKKVKKTMFFSIAEAAT